MTTPSRSLKTNEHTQSIRWTGQARPGQARPGQARPGQARPGQARPGQARPGQARPGQARPGQARPGQAREDRKLFMDFNPQQWRVLSKDFFNILKNTIQIPWGCRIGRQYPFNMSPYPSHTCCLMWYITDTTTISTPPPAPTMKNTTTVESMTTFAQCQVPAQELLYYSVCLSHA